MAAPVLLAANFLAAIQSLLPQGAVWPRDPDAIQTKTLSGLAPSYERNTARANYLLVDAFPATTFELLTEWESTLGLPDPCAGPAPSIQARRAQVVARFANSGGQSAQYFAQFAQNLGYQITVQNFAPARAGQSVCGDPCNGVDWAFAWAVNVPLSTVTQARAGQAVAGDPLASWGNAVLECEIKALKPAHSTVMFQYFAQIYDNTMVDDFGHPILTDTGFPIVT